MMCVLKKSAAAASNCAEMKINSVEVVLDGRGDCAEAQTTSEVLILTGRNLDTSTEAMGDYSYGGYPRVDFTLPAGNINLVVPIAKQSFERNILTVTNGRGKMAVRLNGKTCYGRAMGFDEIELDKNQIGVNCELSSGDWRLAVEAPDRQLKTVVVYGIKGQVNQPYVIGLNCQEADACEAQSGSKYDAVFQGQYATPLPIERMADVTVINLSSSGESSKVVVQIY